MTLSNIRANGVHAVSAACEACGHKADVNVDALPETVTVLAAGAAGRRYRPGPHGIRPRLHGVPDYRPYEEP